MVLISFISFLILSFQMVPVWEARYCFHATIANTNLLKQHRDEWQLRDMV